jgi:trk system potassium uptake protein TrkA
MHVVIMGCGRVGSELTLQLGKAGHNVVIIDKNPTAFDRLPPGFDARTIVGLGFDRDVLEDAGIKEADAFIAVSNGDNSNIVSARVALEHYHVPNVIARIYDPQRAEIYQRLNIPTVATTTWGVKQIMLMLTHPREEIKESLVGGDLFRMRVPVPEHLVGKPVGALNEEGKILVAGVDRMGSGFIPVGSSTFQQGDIAQLILQKDGLELLDELLAPAGEH